MYTKLNLGELSSMNNYQEIKTYIIKNSNICGISSEQVALAKSLVDNKCSDKTLFICEGLWAVEKLINLNFEVTHFLFNSQALEQDKIKDKDLELISKMCSYAQSTFAISQKACQKISDREGFDQFFIIAKLKQYTLQSIEKAIHGKDNVLAIIMDGLEQPGNIGAILRSVECAGGDFAIVTNKQARLNNSRLVRSSLGASFTLPVLEAEIDQVQNWLVKNNFKCVVTDLQAKQNYKEIDYSGRIAIIAGNEHTGISPSWRKVKNAQSIIIPMLGSCESLNVGFASTLVSYEAGLQKFKNIKY